MADDRELLVRWIQHLEATPRPTGWLARLRRARALRRAHFMLEWQADRQEGPSCLEQLRNAQASGFALMWAVSLVTMLFRSHHPLTVGRIALALVSFAIPCGIGVWYMFARFPKRLWRDNERQYALSLEQARALPAAPGRPDAEATASPAHAADSARRRAARLAGSVSNGISKVTGSAWHSAWCASVGARCS